eukprot:PhF_6_TR41608/c0_g1_i1/m.63061/K14777/DDX47, RRP3; ATP-dependent RNA helicase DDX47/RRP3
MSFSSVGLCPELIDTCKACGWTEPTEIQRQTLPTSISGRDLIGVAQTGSGKTGAYALPVIHRILKDKLRTSTSCLVLVPSRELAIQVADQFTMLGGSIGLKVTVIVGGMDMIEQGVQLSQRPHVVVATPGRLKDHLESTKGFNLHKIRFVVLDEADKMLDMDYEKELDAIFEVLPRQRQTILFSATMTAKVDKLQKASLHDPVVIKVSESKYQTVGTLQQYFMFVPYCYRYAYLHYYLTTVPGTNKVIVFCSSTHIVLRLTHILRVLGLKALPLMGKMNQEDRILALDSFRSGEAQVLVCTDVAQRGLDVPDVDVVINFQLPAAAKDYIHRVGRTARNGRTGKAITCVTQYDVDQYLKIEQAIEKKMEEIVVPKEEIMLQLERVETAEREAATRIREEQEMDGMEGGGKRRKGRSVNVSKLMDTDEAHQDEGYGVRVARQENEAVSGTSRKEQR